MTKNKQPDVAIPMMPKPSIYVDLDEDNIDQLKEVELDEVVTIVIVGKVTDLSKRITGSKGEVSGSIRVEFTNIEVLERDNNEMSKLLDEED